MHTQRLYEFKISLQESEFAAPRHKCRGESQPLLEQVICPDSWPGKERGTDEMQLDLKGPH